jgi:NAD(P)-dependent dehydrogenase (short-subunit alcohol dehydrogenase family)
VKPSPRTIVITGASSGIGASAAEALAAQGEHVVVVGRNAQRVREVAERTGADSFVADFERLDDVRSLASGLLERLDRIDVLANNAGACITSGRTPSTDTNAPSRPTISRPSC